ncbi:MAG: exodeoxyribonuclease VII small subunit [Bacteroidales bacterium]|nr:exodeoxyribonuclease VII small subunit [Bacteroidales bacterium]HOY39530.1 exodeoxyribonuclease VII small subunit [Bacteroidales bacterium]HQP04064.1 exodeoxyribonuclease VII small subunit [Bacteroidales bacterium]
MGKEKISYQQALAELEQIVEKIEQQEIDVDELADNVRRATYLINTCKAKLRSTEDELNQILSDFTKD